MEVVLSEPCVGGGTWLESVRAVPEEGAAARESRGRDGDGQALVQEACQYTNRLACALPNGVRGAVFVAVDS